MRALFFALFAGRAGGGTGDGTGGCGSERRPQPPVGAFFPSAGRRLWCFLPIFAEKLWR